MSMHVLLLAGGKGSRLRPYTLVIPKPLIPVGEKPIIEILLTQLKHFGFQEIMVSTGYLGEMIKSYLGTGEKLGLKIQYVAEEQPLGTAGPMSLIQESEDSFLMLNGDLLTDIDFRNLYEFHNKHGEICTICTFRKDEKIELGVLEIENETVLRYIEKPTTSYQVSMGIYVFSKKILEYIPKDTRFDLPDLINLLLEKKVRIVPYEHKGEWLDLGRFDDYAHAEEKIKLNPGKYLYTDG